MEDHEISMILAFRKDNLNFKWIIRLEENSPGWTLIKKSITQNKKFPNLVLNREYKLRGFIPFKFL